MTEQKLATVLDGTMPSDGPLPLPYSAYPRAADVARHGVQPLPAFLPLVDFAQARPHRSSRYATIYADRLTPGQLLQMARVVAASFVRREPQARHLQPPKHPPAGLMQARHADPFGTDSFGSWDSETHLYWIIRLSALTDPTKYLQANTEAPRPLAGSGRSTPPASVPAANRRTGAASGSP